MSNQLGQNQTLLELIYALKGLAQTVEFYHQDLARQLEEASKDRQRELDRIRDIVAKNAQAMAVLPITLSDRVEKLVGRLENDVDEKLDNVFRDLKTSVNEVRAKLDEFIKDKDYPHAPQNVDIIASGPVQAASDDVTGKFELTKSGQIKVALHSSTLKKIWYVLLAAAGGGGLYGVWQAIQSMF